VVNLLLSQGCTAERIGLKKDIVIASNNSGLSGLQLYCTHLVTRNNRPSKESTLSNSIKSKMLMIVEKKCIIMIIKLTK